MQSLSSIHLMQYFSKKSYSVAIKVVLLTLCLLNTESFRSFATLRSKAIRSETQALYSTPVQSTPGTIMTLSRFMIEATRSNPDHADFESLMASIQIACKTIAHLVSRSGISDLTGLQAPSKSPKPGMADYPDIDMLLTIILLTNEH